MLPVGAGRDPGQNTEELENISKVFRKTVRTCLMSRVLGLVKKEQT